MENKDRDLHDLLTADQLIGGVAADAEDRHQILYPQCHWEVA